MMEALDDALALASEHLPYASLPPTARKLLNQATHLRIAPVQHPYAPRRCRIHGQRAPLYVEADLLVGKTPQELVGATPGKADGRRAKTTQAPIPRGLSSDENKMAEGEGFEPPRDLDGPFRFSRPVHSTALPPLRGRQD